MINKYLSKIKNKLGLKTIKTEKEKKETLKQSNFTPEEFKELDSSAFALSRRFRLSLLRKASMLGRKDVGKIGQEVHGWMQIVFGNRYPWLHDNGVFDRAINYALLYYNPEVFNVIKDYDFDHAIINIMILPEKVNYEKFPEFDYDKVIILTQGKTFEESVLWIDDMERYEDGYRVMKTVAPCNFLNMGFTLWDKPVVVLKDAVGMDRLFFEAKTEAKQMVDVQDQILKMHIYTKRQEEITTKEKMLEKDIAYDQLKKRHQYLKDTIKAGDTRNPEEKLKDFAKKYDDVVYKRFIDWKKIIIGVSIAIFVFLIMFGITKYI